MFVRIGSLESRSLRQFLRSRPERVWEFFWPGICGVLLGILGKLGRRTWCFGGWMCGEALVTKPSCARMLMASRIEPCATPNSEAHFASTIRVPGFKAPFIISLRNRSARVFFTRPLLAREDAFGIFKRSNQDFDRRLSSHRQSSGYLSTCS